MIKCFASLFSLFLLSCTTAKISSKDLPSNPISYTFNVSIDSARMLFRDAYFRYHNTMDFDLWFTDFEEKETSAISSEDKGNFPQPKSGGKTAFMVVHVDSSTIYQRSDGKALPYSAKCRMHFIPVESHKVEIFIEVLSSWVTLGKQLLPSAPHFVNNDKIQNVKPTTIDEYKLLLCFGKGLGVYEQMPVLKTQ